MNIGDKQNKLTLIKRTGFSKYGDRFYKTGLFQCECGNDKVVIIKNVTSNNSKSCGCNYKISNKDKKWGRK